MCVQVLAILGQLNDAHSALVLREKAFFDALLIIVRSVQLSHGQLGHAAALIRAALSEPPQSKSIGLVVIAAMGFVCTQDPSKVSDFLPLLRPTGPLAHSAVLLGAALNSLGHVLRSKSEAIAKGIPTLLEWYEMTARFDGITASQRRNIEQSLKLQLTSVLNMPAAARYATMLGESLGRRKQQNLASKATSNKRPAPEPVEDPEEQFSKRKKPSKAFADESDAVPQLDLGGIPFSGMVHALLKTLKRIDKPMLEAKLDAWRPAKTDLPDIQMSDDPRKRGAKAKLSFKMEAEDYYDLGVYRDFLASSFSRLLDGGAAQGLDMTKFGVLRRKEWAQLVARFAVSISDSHVENLLVDYCFGDLSVRSGLLLLWLRYRWMLAHAGDAADRLAYEQAFIKLLGRVESLMELDTSTEAEGVVGDILVSAPGTGLESSIIMLVMRGLGLADMEEIEEGEEPAPLEPAKRVFIFKMLVRMLMDRPGCREDLSSLLQELVVHSNKEIREDAIKVITQTIHLAPLGGIYRGFVAQLLKQVSEDGTAKLDLFIALVPRDLQLLSLLLPLWDEFPQIGKDHLILSLPGALGQAHQHDPESWTGLTSVLASAPKSLVWILLHALPATCKVPTGMAEYLVAQAAEGRIDAGPLAAKDVDREHLLKLLPSFVVHLSEKAEMLSCFQSLLSGPSGIQPLDIFLTLHLSEAPLGLKRCIEACNVCFAHPAIWKPEVLLAVFEALLHRLPEHNLSVAELPTTYMRSVIQALTLHTRALSSGIQAILLRLVHLRVWEAPKLWDGWARACKMLMPGSLQLLVQLPPKQVKDALEAIPEAKGPLKEYLWQQPPSLRSRFAAIMSLVE